ncbi:hypothetical protein PTI98_001628 [Pleurotus ostreatus]|nr:hypothetical protein PTI98_001628 [Pleurotus ostreatus]
MTSTTTEQKRISYSRDMAAHTKKQWLNAKVSMEKKQPRNESAPAGEVGHTGAPTTSGIQVIDYAQSSPKRVGGYRKHRASPMS